MIVIIHIVTTQTNNEDSKISKKKNEINFKLNPSKKNLFSKNNSKPIKKEYSFDYYNNNIDMNAKLSKDSIDNKLYLYTNSRSDKKLDIKTEEFVTKESQPSYHENEFSQNFKKNEIKYNNNNVLNDLLNNENDYILYRNDLKDIKQFFKKLIDIKKDDKHLNKCSSLKSLNNKNNYINDYKNSLKKNNYLEKSSIKNKKNLNISKDKGHFLKNNKKNDNRKKNKKLSIDSKYNKNNLKNINCDGISKRKKTKIILSQNYENKALKHFRSQKSDLLISNRGKDMSDTKSTTFKFNNINHKNENLNLYNYKENIIKENSNGFNYNNDIIPKKKFRKI